MTTERFSKAQFEAVLADISAAYGLRIVERGFVANEFWYRGIIKDLGQHGQVVAEIASSIGRDGYAAATGENSIRIWLSHSNGLPLGNKVQRWVTRVKGWEDRLADTLGLVIAMGSEIHFCEKCRSIEKVFIVKKDGPNKGRLFLKCNCGKFIWLTTTDEHGHSVPVKEDVEEPVKPIPASTKRIPVCPKCGGTLRLRERKSGGYGTTKYWGCSMYPACKFAMDATDDGDVPDYEIKRHKLDTDKWLAAGAVVKPASNPMADRLEEKAAFAQREAAQERNAFLSDPDYQRLAPQDPDFAEVEAFAKRDSEQEHTVAKPTLTKRSAAAMVAKMVKAGATEPPSKFTPSDMQLKIFKWVQDTNNNKTGSKALVVAAGPGTGKTRTGVEMMNVIKPGLKVAFVSFNKHIKAEMAKKAPKGVRVMTFNGMGFGACNKAFSGLELEEDKVVRILEGILDKATHRHLYPAVTQLVSLVKANLSDASDAELDAIVEHHAIELNGDKDTVYAAVNLVIRRDLEQTGSVDYDDQVWLPVVLDLPCETYDFIFVDEFQDTNKANMALVMKSLKPGGRVVAVGDENQSIYGFRGADVNAIPNFIKELNADVLPLSITYRCCKAVVKYANLRFPTIPLEAAPWAVEGVVRYTTENRALIEMQPEDLVLCRCNAPLVAPAFALIRKGIKAIIRGRDIGKGLTILIRKMKVATLPELLQKLQEYSTAEAQKLMAANKASQAQSIQDKVDTIAALADGISTISELEDRIDTIFSDTNSGVVFSSVHKAKGLEANRVFILHPELMPHPMAQQDWEMKQEKNIEWVAITRAKNELIFVNE